jgi:hypothetical protein
MKQLLNPTLTYLQRKVTQFLQEKRISLQIQQKNLKFIQVIALNVTISTLPLILQALRIYDLWDDKRKHQAM